ncbi:MAG: hypothetical protein Q9195_005499 [Heterodermia aff. obscurata]
MSLPLNPPNDTTSNTSRSRPKSPSEALRDDARVAFEKTIDGHYRHGKTGYRQVGALFLTWADDDMQCKDTEVVKLRDLFKDKFHFKTEYFEIPSERWETALHKRLAEFCYEYDSEEDLAIIYYGGHAYEGRETKEFKLAAKFSNEDGLGDPTAFFNDIRTCLRLPKCDQLMILDCCYAAKAFARDHVGKRKFELLTSSAHDLVSPAPYQESSFTTALHKVMKRLIEQNPTGFCTSHLYREVYHSMPAVKPSGKPSPKPLLFDQARRSLGRIWLRPQVLNDIPPKASEEGRYLKLKFRLTESPDLAVMNELALQLQFIPHVDQIIFEKLYAPREQITDFMRLVVLASKLKPLVRKLHARRQRRKFLALAEKIEKKPPASFIESHLETPDRPACDWSSATEIHGHRSKYAYESQDGRKKHKTWPPLWEPILTAETQPQGEVLSKDTKKLPGTDSLTSSSTHWEFNTMAISSQGDPPDSIRIFKTDETITTAGQARPIMSTDSKVEQSSNVGQPEGQGPESRSRYVKHSDLDRLTELPELYTKGQYPIYNKGARGIDPKPYKISKVLGDGQYHLERGGKCDGKVYYQENLQTEP